jgi:hypothetical protein
MSVSSQIITGTIIDKQTKEKIIFAAVFFNDSFVGTNSDVNGNFELRIPDNTFRPLTVSALGYYSETITNYQTDKPLVIYLRPKVFELNEVIVSARARQKNLRMFKENFLGTSDVAMRSEITNESDITLVMKNDTLKAYASKPIKITNYGLGYKSTYYLDKFWYYPDKKAFFISGNMVYDEDLSNDNSKRDYYLSNRQFTYYGSKMHFFRALWRNELDKEGFVIRNMGKEEIQYGFLIAQPDGVRKYFKYHGMLTIEDKMRLTTTWITFLRENVYFDAKGYFDPFAISWDGSMARQRVADMLPYEYSPK